MLMEFETGFGFQVSRLTWDSRTRQVQRSFLYGVGLEFRNRSAIANGTQVLAGGWNFNHFHVSIYRLVDGVRLGQWSSSWTDGFCLPYSTTVSLCVTPSNHVAVVFEQTRWPRGRWLMLMALACQ